MYDKYRNFVRGLSVNWYGRLGVILTTSSFITFIVLEIARILGILTNAYVGLITYLLFPALFIIGLILIPIGWIKYRRKAGKTTGQLLSERFEEDIEKPKIWGTRVFQTILILSTINILFMLAASSQMLHFMDTPRFCGTACHSVMNPEWTTYQVSPHARVRCVDCHVGEGVDALINSKLNGTWQMISVTFDLLERPIPTPVHQLRPARETCEKCHWPEKFYGNKLKTIIHYQHDSLSTPIYTTLALKIDSKSGQNRRGIHWHIGKTNEIRYTSVDDKRETIIRVDSRQVDGSFIRYTNTNISIPDDELSEPRIMDCVDCHNRVTHIYEYPQNAVEIRISDELIDLSLPYVADQAMAAIWGDYPDKQSGLEGVENSFRWFYKTNYPKIATNKSSEIDSAILVLQEIYEINIHPEMNIAWGSYPNHIGHKDTRGCFRCHNSDMVSSDGKSISYDCTLCHSILAYESDRPFAYIRDIDSTAVDYEIREYLYQEFINSYAR